jgi:hypothetical protein
LSYALVTFSTFFSLPDQYARTGFKPEPIAQIGIEGQLCVSFLWLSSAKALRRSLFSVEQSSHQGHSLLFTTRLAHPQSRRPEQVQAERSLY